MARVREGHGLAGQNCCVIGGWLLSLSLCRRSFQGLLNVRPDVWDRRLFMLKEKSNFGGWGVWILWTVER
jgi:hypothetical protein